MQMGIKIPPPPRKLAGGGEEAVNKYRT